MLPNSNFFFTRIKPLVVPNKSLFFSGPGDFKLTAKKYAVKYDLKVITDFADPTLTWEATDAGAEILHEYWRRLSLAYARASSGRAFVLLPDDPLLGTTWYKGTIWDEVEWPLLRKSSAISEILRTNTLLTPTQGLNIKPTWSTPPRHL